ncbi:hypothetical protein [Wenxinia marina]|uniref:Uncharacterized protein n=1 Tax=Wenxinia marina DSM 24838 TaxID=1123501 RepID=A0A0D0QBR9_9RHOB|nr:hypothetical protein [Wenxinia marina]KIQ69707.1 hypothetical protein Wenmar_02071 [Wenxinia marina DSM 24838]GGL60555.1 hypothetical protein GCM10011392_13780 [Wenxinia marina]
MRKDRTDRGGRGPALGIAAAAATGAVLGLVAVGPDPLAPLIALVIGGLAMLAWPAEAGDEAE